MVGGQTEVVAKQVRQGGVVLRVETTLEGSQLAPDDLRLLLRGGAVKHGTQLLCVAVVQSPRQRVRYQRILVLVMTSRVICTIHTYIHTYTHSTAIGIRTKGPTDKRPRTKGHSYPFTPLIIKLKTTVP